MNLKESKKRHIKAFEERGRKKEEIEVIIILKVKDIFFKKKK